MNGHEQHAYLPAVPLSDNFGYHPGASYNRQYKSHLSTSAYVYLPQSTYQGFENAANAQQNNGAASNTAVGAASPGARRHDDPSRTSASNSSEEGGRNNSAAVNSGSAAWRFDELNQLLRSQPVWSDPWLGERSSNDSSPTSQCETRSGSSCYTPRAPIRAPPPAYAGDRLEAEWTGTMPVRVYKNARFSQKLFIGGLPLMAKANELQKAFGSLGNVRVILPKARNPSTVNQINGYCHIVVKDGKSVKRLLSKCQKNIDNPDDTITLIVQSYEYFYDLQLNNTVKRVQVIPWCINDSNYTNQMNSSSEKHVVFVGALHGTMTAEFLGRVMSDLFGNIEFVALDIDRFEYPIGSARVGFTSRESYQKALKTNFVKIKTSRFTKVVQIEPYLEDSACSLCAHCIGVNFCKSDKCFRYYCSQCWERVHACLDQECMMEHQKLVKKRQDGAE